MHPTLILFLMWLFCTIVFQLGCDAFAKRHSELFKRPLADFIRLTVKFLVPTAVMVGTGIAEKVNIALGIL
ncbi:MAG: hypothetical protein [Caudoviricetes sp.]|nr:MAG: hypothetical protein [Caudoviricetes sp.]